MASFNCIICAKEHDDSNLTNVKLSHINITKFKVCESCFEKSSNDNFKYVKDVLSFYANTKEIKKAFKQAFKLINAL